MSVRIDSLAYGGDGVGQLEDGRAVFVPRTSPGDTVAIEIVEDRPRWARARATVVEEPGPARVPAPCPYYDVCGGCSWQHVDYEAQLSWKRQSVVDALERIGRVEAAADIVRECIRSPSQFGYRNKIELSVEQATSRLRIGFAAHSGDRLVEVDRCLLLPDRAATSPKALRGAVRYLSGGRDLMLSRLGLRVAHATRDTEVALWGAPGPFPRRVAADVISQALTATSVVRVLVKGARESRRAKGVEVLGGRGFWNERLAQREMMVSAPSFFQTNTEAAELLVATVLDLIRADGVSRVLDVYAGVGTFTLPLAERAGEVSAIEAVSFAVRDLRRNLESHGRDAEVIGGDAAREMAALGRFDAVLVDPPRKGLSPDALDAVSSLAPSRLVYVSCDPATLARDAKVLVAGGLSLADVCPVDLFPQTYHVETVALFLDKR